MKYIVFSATASKEIYETYFGEDRICFYSCKQARYTGNLAQYYNHSFSRNFIKENDGIYKKIEKFLGAKLPTLTFKGFKDGRVLHFGNTEGCDCLAGQDIAVIGTPHVPEFIYKLLAYQMGYTFEENLQNQVVEHNNCRFWFMTYENERIIESELVQSVGRARLLRKDCTVNLFSNLPLPQAQLLESEL